MKQIHISRVSIGQMNFSGELLVFFLYKRKCFKKQTQKLHLNLTKGVLQENTSAEKFNDFQISAALRTSEA